MLKKAIFLNWENDCPRSSNPCECGQTCGWSSETNRCEPDGVTTCEECPEICIYGSCLTFQTSGTCPHDYDPRLVCQCTEDCAQFGNCCEDVGQCLMGIKIFFVSPQCFIFPFYVRYPDRQQNDFINIDTPASFLWRFFLQF